MMTLEKKRQPPPNPFDARKMVYLSDINHINYPQDELVETRETKSDTDGHVMPVKQFSFGDYESSGTRPTTR